MSYENIMYEKDAGVVKITINRPKALNALNMGVLSELKIAVEEAGGDEDVGVIILTGAGRAFSAGVDLKEVGDHKSTKEDRGRVARALIESIRTIPKVVIAMVNGYCITGALELVLACDLIVASEEAKFGDTHARWGLKPIWGMSHRLPAAVGLFKAKELSFTADIISAQEAEKISLVNRIVPAGELEDTVRQMADKILGNSRDTVAVYKYLYNQGMSDVVKKDLELELTHKLPIRDTEERLKGFKKKK